MALQAEWTRITPAMAVEYLSHAAPNRHIRKQRVEAYARDMQSHNWLVTGQPILFTGSGELIDGQHRLSAIIESGETVELLIIRGIRPDAIKVLDSGVARTFADVLVIEGESKSTAGVLAALVKRMALWDTGLYLQSGALSQILTHHDLAQYLDKHPELRDHAHFATGTRAHPPGISASMFAAVFTLCSRIDPDQALAFCSAWRDGTGLEAGSPILVLRERLVSGDVVGYHTTVSWLSEYKQALAFRAWNHWRKGTKVTKLQLPPGGLTNKNYPLPA